MDFVTDLRLPDGADGDLPQAAAAPHALSRASRGPMRPLALASTRRRLAGKTLATRFRRLDITALAGITLVFLGSGGWSQALATPVRAAAPLLLAAFLTAWSLKGAQVYAFGPREPLWRHGAKVGSAIAVPGVASAFCALVLGAQARPTLLWTLASLTALLALHGAEWGAVRGWRKAGRLTPNIVVVGATANASRLIEAAIAVGDAAILGVFDDRMSRIPKAIHGVPVLGDTQALLTHKLLPYIDRIVITVTPSAQHRVRELIDRLKFLPNAVTLFMDSQGFDAQDATLSRLADAPLTQVSGAREDGGRAGAKRLQDLVLGGLGLAALLPVMGLIALAVRLDSPGPIFFRQRRHGFNNEAILVWKFRSMRHEAADAHAARQVSANDDRVTRVGRIIRRLSLDELPQLFNVVRGEMSLVGPRPHAIGMKTAGEDSAALVAEYAWRHRMKPGLTGWAQINGSIGAVDTPDAVRARVAFDIDYIERQSFWFDLSIIAMTIPALVGARNTVR